MLSIKIFETVFTIDENFWSGKELNVRITGKLFRYIQETKNTYIEVYVKGLSDSDQLMRLIFFIDSINRLGQKNIYIYMPYLPYARQDHPGKSGEPLSLRIIGNLFSSVEYAKLIVTDIHSHHAQSFFSDKIKNIPLSFKIEQDPTLFFALKNQQYDVVLAPDEGAKARAKSVADLLNIKVLNCLKTRNDTTGEPLLILPKGIDSLPQNAKILVVDDICDGGRTFYNLAQLLTQAQGSSSQDRIKVGKLGLLITHGIFSHGITELKKFYSDIYCIYNYSDVSENDIFTSC